MNLIGFVDDQIYKQLQLPDWLAGWNIRIAVRSVLFNDQGQVALMHIGTRNIYKLPGGGVDEEENLEAALKREMLEETGCIIESIGDIGVFIEKRDEWKLFQVSFVYLSKLVEKKELALTDEEQAEGFSLEWAENLESALKLVLSSASDNYDDRYIKIRDSRIIEAAQKIV
ncbi:MAG: NUDIX domain-containing protein [Candidatus Buchananbacteria bacterium]|jgi:ADP-ribose pyrophosphatase YjhB (NUDIX family)